MQFIYDGNFVEKLKLDGSSTVYPSAPLRAGSGGVFEVDKDSGGSVTRTTTYYPAAGAMRIDNAVYYVLKDHLGSASVVTDASGNVVDEQRFYPFGETRFTTGSMFTDKLFTGQREMAGLGIYHYGARFYSPKLGRFLSADTIVPGMFNPQNLNRFSYVRNNPLKYIDPSGHAACRTQEECGDMGTTPGAGLSKPVQKSTGNRRVGGEVDPDFAPLPLPRSGWVDPVTPILRGGGLDYGNGHPGVDLNPDSNENPSPAVVASSYGVVYSSTACTINPCFNSDGLDANDGYGNVVIIGYDYYSLPSRIQANIPQGSTLFMLYAHLEAPSNLQHGNTVVPGQLIGNVGNTGASGGTHLHMEIRVEEVNPLPIGDIHNDAGYTDVHFTWHLLLTPQNPHDFFDIR